MKEWPIDGSIVMFNKLIDPITKIFRKFYKQTKEVTEDIEYDGYNIGKSELSTQFSPKEALTKTNLDYEKEDQDRDLLERLLNIVFCLGVEQGRRIVYKDLEGWSNLTSIINICQSEINKRNRYYTYAFSSEIIDEDK